MYKDKYKSKTSASLSKLDIIKCTRCGSQRIIVRNISRDIYEFHLAKVSRCKCVEVNVLDVHPLYPVTRSMTLQKVVEEIDGLVQDCSNSCALGMELLQSCTKP